MKKYLKWVFTDHYFNNGRGLLKLIGTIYGIIQAVYATPIVYDEWYYGYMPILPLIAAYIAIYGFLIGIIYQPVSIYLTLKRLGRID